MRVRRPSPSIVFAVAIALIVSSGCLPGPQAPVAKGPIDTNTAAQHQSKIRSSNGNKYSVTHQYKDQEFTANWELSNALKKSSQLQMKPPIEWSDVDLYQALEIVLQGHDTKPWYPAIDDTVLRLMRAALKDTDTNRATGIAPKRPIPLP